jgi:hypothetical protein
MTAAGLRTTGDASVFWLTGCSNKPVQSCAKRCQIILKGILPVLAADQGLQTSVYYLDPDQNSVELNVNNYGNEGTATEHIKNSSSKLAYVDPDKMLVGAQRGRVPLGIVALLGVLALASACRLNWITAIQIPLSFIVLGAVFALTVIAPQYRQSFPLRLA